MLNSPLPLRGGGMSSKMAVQWGRGSGWKPPLPWATDRPQSAFRILPVGGLEAPAYKKSPLQISSGRRASTWTSSGKVLVTAVAGLGPKLLATPGNGWRRWLLSQGKESLQETLEQMEKLREQFENLQQGVERLSRSSTEMQVRGCTATQ